MVAELKRKILPLIANCYGKFLHRQQTMGHRVLMYHAVGSPVENDPRGIFSIRPDLFDTHVQWLADHCHGQTVSLSEGLKDLSKATLSITFDDGYADNLHVAAPLLLKHSLPFIVFVTSNFVKEKKKGFLTPQELRKLSELPGVNIGAHGKTHIALARCEKSVCETELSESKKYLEDLTGKTVASLSYPYGSVNSQVKVSVQKCGYAHAASSFFGMNKAQADFLCLKRTEITGHDSLAIFQQKILGWWDWYRLRQLNMRAA